MVSAQRIDDTRGALRTPPADVVDVWAVDLTQPPSIRMKLEGLLDSAERQRVNDLRSEVLRRRYVVAHGAVRSILGSYLGIEAAYVHLTRAPCWNCEELHGKPLIQHAGSSLMFSLSHAHDVAFVAVANGRSVGIDVEWIATAAPLLAEAPDAILSAEELRTLGRLPPGARDAFLTRAWVRKEAVLKASGEGIGGNVMGRLVVADRDGLAHWNGTHYHVTGLESVQGYTGAVAVLGGRAQMLWNGFHGCPKLV